MKKKKGDYIASEQDMKDAWIIWNEIKFYAQDTLKKQDDIEDMFKTIEIGLRVLLDRPDAAGSPGEEIVKRLYASWELKSKWADDANKKMKDGEIDIYGAYSQAVIQTVLTTIPIENEEKFYEEREKDRKELQERINEWKELHNFQETEGNLKN